MADHDKKMQEIQEFLNKIRFKDISIALCAASALRQDWRSAVIAKVFTDKEFRFTGIRECLRRSFRRSAWVPCTDASTKKQGVFTGSIRPQRGRIKLNCDAAVGLANSSFGCIVRDEEGSFIVACWGFTSTSIPLVAVFYAVYYGLLLLQTFNLCYVDIEVDCLTVALILQNYSLSASWRVSTILEDCRKICTLYPHWKVSHSNRDNNVAAHALARESLTTKGCGRSFSPPGSLRDVLSDDIQNYAAYKHQAGASLELIPDPVISLYKYGDDSVPSDHLVSNIYVVHGCNSYA